MLGALPNFDQHCSAMRRHRFSGRHSRQHAGHNDDGTPYSCERYTGNPACDRIKTDATPVEAPKNPDICTVYALLRLFARPERMQEIHGLYVNGGAAYGHLKQELFELIDARFAEARMRRKELLANPDDIRKILAKGADKARAKAGETLALARDRVGLRY